MTSTLTLTRPITRPLVKRVPTVFGRENIIGSSRAVREVTALAERVAANPAVPVLLVGETGTGKELFARAIHNAGPDVGEPFVAVNCAAIPESLLESELFGHERGAFTDAREQKRGLAELAGRGTLFLDEIGELPLKLQPKLLRLLEERRIRRLGGLQEIEVRCRIVTATNLALEEAVLRGEFREDLFYRLNVFRILLPALRERAQDIEPLARHFLALLGEQQGTDAKVLDAKATAALRAYNWPGNIRELKNVIERATLLADGREVQPCHLTIQHRTRATLSDAGTPVAEIRIPPQGKSLDDIEREAICLTLELARGNQSATARILGISRPTLARKLRRYGLSGGGDDA
ncbi:MAG: sigma-54 dependent transcriptional regulator [Gemmatimonadetes bacterium]|nr:sigma-54 dependent transcriptional regulator [Gemmatimonadota bacterium]